MTKLATLAMLLIAAVAAHPGHGNVINAEQKSAWTAAFAAKRAHLASQVKFHTSELLRYKNRDAQYEAIEAVWSGEGSVVDHFKSTLTVSNDFRIKENDINKVVTVNQTARRPLLDKYYKLLRVAMATKQVRRMETADAVTAAYKKWIDTSKSANAAEQAFHNVEFKEFEGEEACIKEAETRMADAATLDEDMRYYYGQCMKKVREEIKKEVVNVADQNRKVGRKDLGKLWMAFVKAGYEFEASERQKTMAEQRAANVAKNAAAKAVRGMRGLAKQSPATRRQLSSKYQEAVRDLKAYLDKF
jgi:hypothetical protein